MKKFIFLVIAAMVLLLIILLFSNNRTEGEVMWGRTDKERTDVLKGFGWEVSDTPIESEAIRLPGQMDAVYSEYNKIQKKAGLSLENYLGMAAVRYTYEVKNHTNGGAHQVRANLIVCEGKVIAGDIMITAIDGFMHALNERE